MNIINFVISAGLLWTYWQKRQGKIEWNPPIRAGYVVTTFFTLVNLYLIVCPYIPPTDGESVYETLPYWIHCVVSWGIFGIGALYYLFWAQIMPKLRHYHLETKDVLGEDGFWKVKIIKVFDKKTEKHESTNDADSNSLEYSNSNNYSMTNVEQHLEYIDSTKKGADSDTEMHVRTVDHQL